MLYATAYYYSAILITEDEELKSTGEKAAYRPPGLMGWADVKGMLGGRPG